MLKKVFKSLLTLICIIYLNEFIYAQDVNQYITKDEFMNEISEYNKVIEDKNVQIFDLINENLKDQNNINALLSIYGTWTTIIAFLVALFGIVFPIIVPYIINKLNNHKIIDLQNSLKEYINYQNEKSILINNALNLATGGDYGIAIDCLKDILNENKNDLVIKLYIANFSYRYFNSILNNENIDQSNKDQFLNKERVNIISCINMYYEISKVNKQNLNERLNLGNVFPKSFIHEIAYMENMLYNDTNAYSYTEHIKICKNILEIIEHELKVNNPEELLDEDQSNVFLMMYKDINYHITKLYYDNKNINALKQIEWTIKLYEADNFVQSENILDECKNMLRFLKI